jgi:hypothetical protein
MHIKLQLENFMERNNLGDGGMAGRGLVILNWMI